MHKLGRLGSSAASGASNGSKANIRISVESEVLSFASGHAGFPKSRGEQTSDGQSRRGNRRNRNVPSLPTDVVAALGAGACSSKLGIPNPN
jgi:hypothetical protein